MTSGVTPAAGLALTLADIAHVVEELCSAMDKWHKIGIQVGLSERDLKSIETNYPRHDDRLREVISKWVSGGKATWGTVIEALKSPMVSELQLAEKLKLKHFGSDLARASIDTAKKSESKLNRVVFVNLDVHVHAYCVYVCVISKRVKTTPMPSAYCPDVVVMDGARSRCPLFPKMAIADTLIRCQYCRHYASDH